MMMFRGVAQSLSKSLLRQAHRTIGHIKNMDEENVRVIADQLEREPTLIKTNRVYKPTYTIEFDRTGEALIYSANPLKNETIYFKYPYILCTSIPTQTSP
jgi:hypothetical protein